MCSVLTDSQHFGRTKEAHTRFTAVAIKCRRSSPPIIYYMCTYAIPIVRPRALIAGRSRARRTSLGDGRHKSHGGGDGRTFFYFFFTSSLRRRVEGPSPSRCARPAGSGTAVERAPIGPPARSTLCVFRNNERTHVTTSSWGGRGEGGDRIVRLCGVQHGLR